MKSSLIRPALALALAAALVNLPIREAPVARGGVLAKA